MKTYRITYRMAPAQGPTKELLIEASNANRSQELAVEWLRLRYPNHAIKGVEEAPEFVSDVEELYHTVEARR